MRDDYLWDRSGEPDPEIERLERTLQSLRHKPTPLALPVLPARRRLYSPGLAAAAAVVLTVLAAGMWAVVRRSDDKTTQQLLHVRPTTASLDGLYRTAESFDPTIQVVRAAGPSHVIEERRAPSLLARRARQKRFDERMMREEELAAEKLMLALRLASSKLNLVHRRIQVNEEHRPAS